VVFDVAVELDRRANAFLGRQPPVRVNISEALVENVHNVFSDFFSKTSLLLF
jgi:hypothetical protein